MDLLFAVVIIGLICLAEDCLSKKINETYNKLNETNRRIGKLGAKLDILLGISSDREKE